MKHTHNTLLAYVKGTALVGAMAAGTAVLMAFTSGTAGVDPALENHAQQRLAQAAQSLPDQLVLLDARQAAYR